MRGLRSYEPRDPSGAGTAAPGSAGSEIAMAALHLRPPCRAVMATIYAFTLAGAVRRSPGLSRGARLRADPQARASAWLSPTLRRR